MQSVPGPGQTPQVFETATALTATIAGNAIPAATSQPWQLNGGDLSTWIAGTANNIQVGNVLLFVYSPATGGNPIPSATGPVAVVNVTSVTIDSTLGNTFITWDQALPSGSSGFKAGETAVSIYIFRTKAALYGVNAPAPGMFASTTLANIPPYNNATFTTLPTDWPFASQYSDNHTINLDNAYTGLNPAASGSNAPAGRVSMAGAHQSGHRAVVLARYRLRRNRIPTSTHSRSRLRSWFLTADTTSTAESFLPITPTSTRFSPIT